jgi:hypothetical protein
VRFRAVLLLLLPAVLGCEKPRERACRALSIQAKDAEEARTAATPDPRIAANRARSAARWVRSNAVEDADLKKDAESLAAALDRLADARVRLVDAYEVLGATDTADLVARAERVNAHVSAIAAASSIRIKPCPYYEAYNLIDDPRCQEWQMHSPHECAVHDEKTTLQSEAAICAGLLEALAHQAETPSEASEMAKTMRETAAWAKTLPEKPVKVTVESAKGVPHFIADRGRADAEVAESIAALRTKCGP